MIKGSLKKKSTSVDQLVKSRVKLRLYLLSKLPLAFMAGLRIDQMDEGGTKVSVPFNYFTKNPFRSIYFAPLSMAAELSSGLLAMSAIGRTEVPVSMLVLSMRAEYIKKAKTRIFFHCNDGQKINEAVFQSVLSNEGQTVESISIGIDENGNVVARFWFTWTFKSKNT